MNLKTLLASLTVLIAACSLQAQADSVMKFSLLEAQNYAIENFFLTKNAELDIEVSKKVIWETTAIGLPQVSTNVDFQYIPNPPIIEFPNFDDPDGPPMELPLALETNTTYGATVSQLIFSGEYIVGLQAAKVYRSLSEENYDKIKIDTRENVASSYYAILILDANKKVLIETLENLRQNADETRKMYNVGLVEDTEVDQLELTVKRTENDLATLENQIEYMHRLFKYQLGLSSSSTVDLSESIEFLIAQNIISDSLYNFALEDNIDYQMLETQERLQQLSMNREKTKYLPTLSGFYNYSDQTESSEFNQSINHVFGVSAAWPIFQSGSRMAKVSQARIALEQAQNVKDQESQRLILTAQQSKFDYQTALNRYYNEKLNFELSEKVLNKTSERYKQGMVSSLELSIINTQYLQAQLTYSTAIQELLTAKIALDKAHNRL